MFLFTKNSIDINSLIETRMHSSRMRTVRSSSRLSGGGLPQCMLGYQPPPDQAHTSPDQAPPWEHTPPEQTPP